jgi:hypothetical protein
MPSPFDQAQYIYRAIKDDPALIEEKRKEYLEASRAITSNTGGLQIQSATVNGQSFAGKATSTPAERLEILSLLMWMLNRGSSGGKTTIARFL